MILLNPKLVIALIIGFFVVTYTIVFLLYLACTIGEKIVYRYQNKLIAMQKQTELMRKNYTEYSNETK